MTTFKKSIIKFVTTFLAEHGSENLVEQWNDKKNMDEFSKLKTYNCFTGLDAEGNAGMVLSMKSSGKWVQNQEVSPLKFTT